MIAEGVQEFEHLVISNQIYTSLIPIKLAQLSLLKNPTKGTGVPLMRGNMKLVGIEYSIEDHCLEWSPEEWELYLKSIESPCKEVLIDYNTFNHLAQRNNYSSFILGIKSPSSDENLEPVSYTHLTLPTK